ncbi:hypothetical protein PR048_011369 [Dryococelus australis]|uniref:Uncharacterized protein n=1 Tax=Dryococelus australis TaxID=614101 RepID=A0ABQ9HMN8_9NEOP|nr:hypothetical protein PR048_011369 [Dryococelus australis]
MGDTTLWPQRDAAEADLVDFGFGKAGHIRRYGSSDLNKVTLSMNLGIISMQTTIFEKLYTLLLTMVLLIL